MRAITTTLILTLALFLFTACSKEETAPSAPEAKPSAIETAQQAAATSDMNNGRKTYETSCASCHDSGAMGAPTLGDKTAWVGYMSDGLEHMTQNAINGIGKMPAKGGNMRLRDAEVKAAVEYIIQQSK